MQRRRLLLHSKENAIQIVYLFSGTGLGSHSCWTLCRLWSSLLPSSLPFPVLTVLSTWCLIPARGGPCSPCTRQQGHRDSWDNYLVTLQIQAHKRWRKPWTHVFWSREKTKLFPCIWLIPICLCQKALEKY